MVVGMPRWRRRRGCEGAGAMRTDAVRACGAVVGEHIGSAILERQEREQHRQESSGRAEPRRPPRPSPPRATDPRASDGVADGVDAAMERCRRPAARRRPIALSVSPQVRSSSTERTPPRFGGQARHERVRSLPVCGSRSPTGQGPRARVAWDACVECVRHRIPASSRMCGRFHARPPVPCATCERCGHTPRRARRRPGCGRRADPTPRSRSARVLRGGRGARRGRPSRLRGVRQLPRLGRQRTRRPLLRRRGRAGTGNPVRRRQPRAAGRPRHADGADAARRAGRGRPRARGRGAPHPTAGPLERGAHVGRPDAPWRGCLHRPRGGPPAACGRPDGRRARHRRRHPGDAEDPGRRPRMGPRAGRRRRRSRRRDASARPRATRARPRRILRPAAAGGAAAAGAAEPATIATAACRRARRRTTAGAAARAASSSAASSARPRSPPRSWRSRACSAATSPTPSPTTRPP